MGRWRSEGERRSVLKIHFMMFHVSQSSGEIASYELRQDRKFGGWSKHRRIGIIVSTSTYRNQKSKAGTMLTV